MSYDGAIQRGDLQQWQEGPIEHTLTAVQGRSGPLAGAMGGTPSMESWLDQLNPAQREAVTHGQGPLLVVAGAGTGKTRTLACRVAWLLQGGVAPDRIMLLTFTRRAAAEMLSRAARLVSGQTATRVWGGTFHAVANRLLRRYGRFIGLSPDFTVMDQADAADLMNLIRNELGLGKGTRRFPRKQTLVSIYSRMMNAAEKLTDVLDTRFPWCADDREGIAAIFESYTRRKREGNVLDYDDLLLMWNALALAPGIGEKVADRFEHILVDEYQDTNAVQAQILRNMRKRHPHIMVVGDDAQAIYSFRAATIRNILEFPRQFPDTKIVTLEQNYRSIGPILAASNAVMQQAPERYTKDLWSHRSGEQKPVLVRCLDEENQCQSVCGNILSHLERGVALARQGVLFRAGHHSDMLEVELAKRNIPFHKYGGLKFMEAAHIKDMLALLRIVENPLDEVSWFRILPLLQGIGPGHARRIMNALGVRRPATDGEPAVEGLSPLKRLATDDLPIPGPAKDEFAALRRALLECAAIPGEEQDGDAPAGSPAPSVAVQVERLRQFYEPVLERTHDNARIRARDIEQLEHIARGYRSRRRFITDLTLDPPQATSDLAQPPFLEEDYLVLSTIHSAKGCEWDVVHILHAADGMIPSDMAVGETEGVDEERRLLYVAMTRARDRLYIYFPLRYYHHRWGHSDSHGYAQLSRFLTKEVRSFLEDRTAHSADGPSVGLKTMSIHDVDAWIRGLTGG